MIQAEDGYGLDSLLGNVASRSDRRPKVSMVMSAGKLKRKRRFRMVWVDVLVRPHSRKEEINCTEA